MAEVESGVSILQTKKARRRKGGKRNGKAGPAVITFKLQISPPVLLSKPTLTKESRTAHQLVAHLDHIEPHRTWLELWPRHAVYNTAAGQAVAALTRALDYNRGGRTSSHLAASALQHHGAAIQLLQSNLHASHDQAVSDDALICAAALATFQVTMNGASRSRREDTRSHWIGMHAILQARDTNHEMSDIARAVVFCFSNELAGLSMISGSPSTLEHQRWLSLAFASLRPLQEDVLKLRKVEYRLLLQAPSLLCGARAVRERQCMTTEEMYSIIELTERLYCMTEDAAESAILHRSTIRKTSDETSDSILPCSLTFSTKDELLCCLMYWHTRIKVINCCLRITEHYPISTLETSKLESERDRMYMNILMSYEHAVSLGNFAATLASKALTQGWTMLRSTTRWRGMDSSKVVDWVLPRLATASHGWLESSQREVIMEQFDLGADMLQGGPLCDFLHLRQRKSEGIRADNQTDELSSRDQKYLQYLSMRQLSKASTA